MDREFVKVLGRTPGAGVLLDALDAASIELGLTVCYHHQGRYHFSLGAGWSLALSADSAGRIRVETCRLCRPETTMWTQDGNLGRLAGLVRLLSSEAREPA